MEQPRAAITVLALAADGPPDRWRVTWRLTNAGTQPLVLVDAWVPHGRFRGEGHVALDTVVAPSASTRLELCVSASEPPGTIVENAFLILRTDGWRIFARMRIEFDDASRPTPIVESVTVQPIQ